MVKLSEIISFFKQQQATIIEGSCDLNTLITGGRNIVEANSHEITFISAKYKVTAEKLLSTSKAALVVLDKSFLKDVQNKKYNFYLVVSDNPKNLMVDCLKFYFEEKVKPEIHSTALINSESKIGTNNFIGAYTVIDKDVIIGNNCVIENHVTIKSRCIIGNNVLIKSGAVIGGDMIFNKTIVANNDIFINYGISTYKIIRSDFRFTIN